jgi:glycosyltransferase involved in cell wall biosynthesis
MERIKTAIILPYFGSGGAEKMSAQLAAGMDSTVFDTEVFCVYGEPQNNHLEQMVQDKGVPIHFIRKKRGFSPAAMVRLFRALNAFDPDVVHTHLYACLYAFPWPLLRKKPFLHTFHLPPELENRRFLRRIISKLLIGGKVMSPVAISHQNQKFLAKYYDLNQAEIPVVYNPVELSKFDDPKPRTNSEFTFITAGRFSAQKNQKLMLRAFAAFLQRGHDANLVLLGKGEEEENLRALAQELGIRDRVDFAGFVVNVEDYLTNADVFLLSSDFEALPLALLEAMAAGLPIISTDVGGVRDIVTDNGILVSPGDLEGMVRAMEELFQNRDVLSRMSEAGKRNVRTYDVSNTVTGYSGLYRRFARK